MFLTVYVINKNDTIMSQASKIFILFFNMPLLLKDYFQDLPNLASVLSYIA